MKYKAIIFLMYPFSMLLYITINHFLTLLLHHCPNTVLAEYHNITT
jgi:hypothetical protein